ncbi:MAG: hypothetical protein AB1916_08775 [Thermodesulfobacteriota bacterium]
MHRILAGMVAAAVLLAGLALAGEPVDWSKAFERRKDDFDWSRVTNRTTATPGGPVDWSRAFAKPGQAQAAPQSPAAGAAGEPVPLDRPRSAAKPSLPEETLSEPVHAKPEVPARAPARPAAPPAPPAPAPDFAPPAPAPAPVPQPVPPIEPATPAAQAAPPTPAPHGGALPPADTAESPARPAAPVEAAPPGKAAEETSASRQTPPPATQEVQPAAPSPAPVPEPAQVQAPARPEPAPARPAAKKAPAPRQVAAVEQSRPGPLFPKKGYDEGQVAHFLAVALPAPDGSAAAQARPMILTRWQGDVRLRVSGRNTAGAEAQVRAAAEEIAAALAGQGRISLREAEPANLLVYVLPSGPGDSPGYVQNAYDAAAITGSKVVVYADKAGRSSVLRLLLAALGLPGPAPAGQDSVLAAAAPAGAGLTALDRTALDLLYSPVLSPGMDQASARQAARSLR